MKKLSFDKIHNFTPEKGHHYLMLAFTGSYLRKLNPAICWIDKENNCYSKQLEFICSVPFIPTFKKASGGIDREHFICNELTYEENENLNPCVTWNGGSSYSLKWNDESPFAWTMYFFPDELK